MDSVEAEEVLVEVGGEGATVDAARVGTLPHDYHDVVTFYNYANNYAFLEVLLHSIVHIRSLRWLTCLFKPAYQAHRRTAYMTIYIVHV